MAKLSMDIFIEALFQAVLSEENKPLSVRHRQVKDRILEAEGAIRTWTKPKLSDPDNERVLLEFRERLRHGSATARNMLSSVSASNLKVQSQKDRSRPIFGC
jgi:hypothetical protein